MIRRINPPIAVMCMLIGVLFTWSALKPVSAQPSADVTYPVYNVNYITTNATTAVLIGSGVLHSLCVTDFGASSNTATVYDSLAGSGTIIALFDTVTFDGCALLDVRVTTGITIVTATGTAPEITVSYRAL
ncbi:hypothetical protein LCGC14_0609760 [marine sediment metagenome]|uniref:Uncharacterized protein n=1 Tax=marine sediment metagenome TaxID=412755 RepID=A0A0F9R822_9ZZZZ